MRRIVSLLEEVLRYLLLATRVTRIPWVRRRVFGAYFARNTWGDSESRSGGGSSFVQTEAIRRELPGVFTRHGIRTLLDIPCGDGHWWRHVDHDLDKYIGADIVPEVVAKAEMDDRRSEYRCLDVATDILPPTDAVLCRDLLVHFSEALIADTLRNFKQSGATYLITTTFPGRKNKDIETGHWRPIDLQAAPFNFPEPFELINENCTEGAGLFADKSLGVWRLADIPA